MPLITNNNDKNTIYLHVLGHWLIVTVKNWTTQLATDLFTIYKVRKESENIFYE